MPLWPPKGKKEFPFIWTPLLNYAINYSYSLSSFNSQKSLVTYPLQKNNTDRLLADFLLHRIFKKSMLQIT
jgi:hypothetical protein